MFTTYTEHMVSGRVKLDSSLLLDLALPCCLEPSWDRWPIKRETPEIMLSILILIYSLLCLTLL